MSYDIRQRFLWLRPVFAPSQQKIILFIKFGVMSILFIVPLSFYKYNPYPLVSIKIAIFQTMVEIIFALWLALAITNKNYRPQLTPVTFCLLVFIAIITITSISGVDLERSLSGTVDKKINLIAMAHFLAFFLVLSSLYKDMSFLLFKKIIVGAGIILSLVAIAQHFNLVASPILGGGIERPGGLFSNAPFLAGYLIFGAFFSIWLASTAKLLRDKIIFWTATGIFAYTIIFVTQTRGAIIGLLIGVLVYLGLEYKRSLTSKEWILKSRFRSIKILVFILLIVLVGFFLATKTSPLWQEIPGINRFTTPSAKENLAQRIVLWQIGWEGFKERPLTGWGVENFEVVFNKFYNPKLYPGINYVFLSADRPFSVVIEWLTAAGITGFLSYLLILAAALYSLAKTNISHKAIFTSLLSAYFIQNLVLFDTIATYPLFFFLLAYIDKEYKNSAVNFHSPLEDTDHKLNPNPILFATLVTIGLICTYYLNLNTVRAENLAYQANILIVKNNDVYAGSLYYKRALAIPSLYQNAIAYNFSQDIRRGYAREFPANDWEKLFFDASSALEKKAFLSPANFIFQLELADLYNVYAPKNNSFIAKAVLAEKNALTLAPNSYQVYLTIAKTKLLAGDRDASVSYLSRAFDLNPKLEYPLITLAKFYYEIGNPEKSNTAIEAALRQSLLPKYANEYITFGDVRAFFGDDRGAILFYIGALNSSFANDTLGRRDELLANTKLNLALSYYRLGDKENARKTFDNLEQDLRKRNESGSYDKIKIIRKFYNL